MGISIPPSVTSGLQGALPLRDGAAGSKPGGAFADLLASQPGLESSAGVAVADTAPGMASQGSSVCRRTGQGADKSDVADAAGAVSSQSAATTPSGAAVAATANPDQSVPPAPDKQSAADADSMVPDTAAPGSSGPSAGLPSAEAEVAASPTARAATRSSPGSPQAGHRGADKAHTGQTSLPATDMARSPTGNGDMPTPIVSAATDETGGATPDETAPSDHDKRSPAAAETTAPGATAPDPAVAGIAVQSPVASPASAAQPQSAEAGVALKGTSTLATIRRSPVGPADAQAGESAPDSETPVSSPQGDGTAPPIALAAQSSSFGRGQTDDNGNGAFAAVMLPVPAAGQSAAYAATGEALPAPSRTLTTASGETIAVRVARAIRGGDQTMSVELHPADLGRIEVRVAFHADGGITLRMVVDKPEAYQALVQDRAALEQQFAQAGIDLGSNGLDLRFGQSSDQSAQRPFHTGYGRSEPPDPSSESTQPMLRYRSGLVDIVA